MDLVQERHLAIVIGVENFQDARYVLSTQPVLTHLSIKTALEEGDISCIGWRGKLKPERF